MKCPHCGQEHPDSFQFCPTTGNDMQRNEEFLGCSNIECPDFGKRVLPLDSLKSATKPFSVLIGCTRPLITGLSNKLRLKHPLLPTISPYPTMRLEAIRSIIPISCRRYPKSVWNIFA